MTDPSIVVSSEDDQPVKTAEDLLAEQVTEWGTYRAKAAIDFYGQRAYNVGDKVPVSAVKDGEGGWIDPRLVERIPDQPEPLPPPPTVDPATVAAPPVSSPDAVVDLTPDDAPAPTSTPES
jgi:hypothetical protein